MLLHYSDFKRFLRFFEHFGFRRLLRYYYQSNTLEVIIHKAEVIHRSKGFKLNLSSSDTEFIIKRTAALIIVTKIYGCNFLIAVLNE